MLLAQQTNRTSGRCRREDPGDVHQEAHHNGKTMPRLPGETAGAWKTLESPEIRERVPARRQARNLRAIGRIALPRRLLPGPASRALPARGRICVPFAIPRSIGAGPGPGRLRYRRSVPCSASHPVRTIRSGRWPAGAEKRSGFRRARRIGPPAALPPRPGCPTE